MFFRIGKQDHSGEFKWAKPKDLGISSSNFEYSNQSDLENQIERIVSLIDKSIIPWLEADEIEKNKNGL